MRPSRRTFRLNVVDIHGDVYTGMVLFAAVPAELGEIGIMPGHAPLLSGLQAGELRITAEDGQKQILFLEGGLLEIQPNIVTILANASMRIMDIDIHDTQSRIKVAEAALAKKNRMPPMDFAKAELELQRDLAKLNAYQHYLARKQNGEGERDYNWTRPTPEKAPGVNVQGLDE